MRFWIILFATLFSMATKAGEAISYKVSLSQQSCRRADATKPFDCHNSGPLTADLSVTLKSAEPEGLEEQAFQGESDEIGLSVGSYQYITKIILRKSVYATGKVVEYRSLLQSYKYDQNPTIYQTTVVSNQAALKTPVILLLGRNAPSGRFNEQNYISLGE
jgi:hypothetical protein